MARAGTSGSKSDWPLDLIVNAGGGSRRMGQNKALLPVPPDQEALIAHVIRRLLPLVTGKVIVVTNDAAVAAVLAPLPQVEIVPDRWAGAGALGGVATGLSESAGWAMVTACDMPLVQPAIYVRLLAHAARHPDLDAVIPRVGGQGQPFHGLWHPRCLPLLEAQIASGVLGVQTALEKLAVAWLDEAALAIQAGDAAFYDAAFYNVNTPEEWAVARKLLSQQA